MGPAANPVEQLELWWEQARREHQLALEAAKKAVEAAAQHPKEVGNVSGMLEQLHLKLEQMRSQFVLLPEALDLRAEALSVLEAQIRETRAFLEECRTTPWLRGIAWQMIEEMPNLPSDETVRVLLEEYVKPRKIASVFAVGEVSRLIPLAGWIRTGGVTISKTDLFEAKLLLERGNRGKYLAKPKIVLQETGLSIPETISEHDAVWLSDDFVRAWQQLPERELRRSLRFLGDRVDYLFFSAKAKWLPLLEPDWQIRVHGELAAARRATLGKIFQVAEIQVMDPISQIEEHHPWRISSDTRLYLPSIKYYFGGTEILLLELHRDPLQTFVLASPELENWRRLEPSPSLGIPRLKWNGQIGKGAAWLLEIEGSGAHPLSMPADAQRAAATLLRIARLTAFLRQQGLYLNYLHPDAFILDAGGKPWLARLPRLDVEQQVDDLDSFLWMLATQPPVQWPPASPLALEAADFPEPLRGLRQRILGTNNLTELITALEALA